MLSAAKAAGLADSIAADKVGVLFSSINYS